MSPQPDGTFATHEEIRDGLYAWAKGSRPLQAAVIFLATTGERLHRTHPMVGLESFVDDAGQVQFTGRVYLEVFEDSDDTWDERTGHMSSGERATWELIRSMCRGELERWFWSLDAYRQSALTQALISSTDL